VLLSLLVAVPLADAQAPVVERAAQRSGHVHPGIAGHLAAKVKLHPCLADKSHRCGKIMRPLDPKDASLGRIGIHFELIRRHDRSRPSLGTIVAVEGGPGYATTWSRSGYEDLYGPLLDRRQLLLVDQRGTGRSGPILCKRLQSYQGNRVNAIGKCGRQLGARSDVYGSAFAADDMAAVLDHLGIDKVDMYGDSYGTYFTQTFAVRHPDRVRSITLDGAYFVDGHDPWYSDTNRALRYAFNIACDRSPMCSAHRGSSMQRIRHLAELLRHGPIVGKAPNAGGVVRRAVFTNNRLIELLTGAATSPTIYRELDAAAAAALRPHPYIKPLLRLQREAKYVGGAGPFRLYSEGMYLAVACNDYAQPYDMTSPVAKRPQQFQRSIGQLRDRTPDIFGPFTVKEWVRGAYGYYDDCIKWPKPSRWVHAVPRRADFPDVPTLVFDGDLDSLTSPEGARDAAAHFPSSTYVETYNMTHVSAVSDYDQCASLIARHFVQTLEAGDTSCAKEYHENRLVGRFARTADGTGWASGTTRTARIANATLADVIARWWQGYDHTGVGLQGGSFHYRQTGHYYRTPVIHWNLDQVRWVKDVAVSGTMRWNRRSGAIVADVTVGGSGTSSGTLHLSWNDLDRHSVASARGMVGGQRITVQFPSA
jgi:pimeloyl-ACP methyl ester carboxylesterase